MSSNTNDVNPAAGTYAAAAAAAASPSASTTTAASSPAAPTSSSVGHQSATSAQRVRDVNLPPSQARATRDMGTTGRSNSAERGFTTTFLGLAPRSAPPGVGHVSASASGQSGATENLSSKRTRTNTLPTTPPPRPPPPPPPSAPLPPSPPSSSAPPGYEHLSDLPLCLQSIFREETHEHHRVFSKVGQLELRISRLQAAIASGNIPKSLCCLRFDPQIPEGSIATANTQAIQVLLRQTQDTLITQHTLAPLQGELNTQRVALANIKAGGSFRVKLASTIEEHLGFARDVFDIGFQEQAFILWSRNIATWERTELIKRSDASFKRQHDEETRTQANDMAAEMPTQQTIVQLIDQRIQALNLKPAKAPVKKKQTPPPEQQPPVRKAPATTAAAATKARPTTAKAKAMVKAPASTAQARPPKAAAKPAGQRSPNNPTPPAPAQAKAARGKAAPKGGRPRRN